jgi:DNA-binding response OmpR family regulator
MNIQKREQIQSSLRSLADSYAAMMTLLEQTFALLCDEMSLDPLTYFRSATAQNPRAGGSIVTDKDSFVITYRKKSCFLGNTLPFKLLAQLAQRPNVYVSYETLLAEVWDGSRTDASVRSVVKVLRKKLREADLEELAEAIDGRVRGHYALKLGS